MRTIEEVPHFTNLFLQAVYLDGKSETARNAIELEPKVVGGGGEKGENSGGKRGWKGENSGKCLFPGKSIICVCLQDASLPRKSVLSKKYVWPIFYHFITNPGLFGPLLWLLVFSFRMNIAAFPRAPDSLQKGKGIGQGKGGRGDFTNSMHQPSI